MHASGTPVKARQPPNRSSRRSIEALSTIAMEARPHGEKVYITKDQSVKQDIDRCKALKGTDGYDGISLRPPATIDYKAVQYPPTLERCGRTAEMILG